MKSKTFFILFSLLIFTCCKNSKKTDIVDLPYRIEIEKNLNNFKSVTLSDIGKKLEYIPLETTPDNLIGRINRIALCKSYIFISDGNKLQQFERNGKFLRQIGIKGRGPGEYTYLCDFCINKQTERIYVLDERSLLTFDFTGQLINSSGMSFLSLNFIVKDTNSLVFYLANLPAKNNDPVYSWYITDMKGIPSIKYENYHKRLNRSGAIADSPIYLFNKTAHFIEFGSDTLFYLKNIKPEPYVIFDFGKIKLEHDPVISKDNRKEVFERQARQLWPRFINENNRYLFLTLYWGFSDSINYCIFNKQTLETTFLANNNFKNDLDGVIPFWPRYIYNDSILVDYIDAFKLLRIIDKNRGVKSNMEVDTEQSQLFNLSKQLTENSNPVLIVLK